MFPISDPYLVTKRKLMNLFPKGGQHPFLYKLSYLIYYLTQFLLLWNPIPPYLRQIFWHLFYYGRRPPIHNFIWRRAMGLWGHLESEQSRWKQVHPGAVSPYDSLGESLWCPVGSFHHLRTLGLYTVFSFHLMFKVLLTCTKSAAKAWLLSEPMLVGSPNLGNISLSRHQATSDALSVQVGKASTHSENVHTMTSR